MRLTRFAHDGEVRCGFIEGAQVVDTGAQLWSPVETGHRFPLGAAEVLAPVVPSKIVCIGLNYRDHAEEAGLPLPDAPLVFAKFPNTIVGDACTLAVPPVTFQLDHEAELGVVIGRRARDVPASSAMDHVLGFTCVNDLSARDLQFADGQWTRGKSLDDTCPVGPFIVTPDEVGDGTDLGITCTVNGTKVQDSSTSQMIWSPAELVSYLSRTITLEPGDLIATGTPAGVGFVQDPPSFLEKGDRVVVEIERVGRLESIIGFR